MSATSEISPDFPYQSKFIDVLGSKLHYIEQGSGDPILFLHGNPESSYIWRNIIPHLSPLGRCVAPDLIGFGKSDKPDIEYRVFDHIKYVEAFIDALGLENITFVIHDWGSAIGFHYAMGNPDNVKGLAMMEAHLRPIPTWRDFADDEQIIEGFKAFRTADVGWDLIVNKNVFLEQILPACVKRKLSDEEIEAYQAPFKEAASRRPLWRFPNDIPVEGEPADTAALFGAYSEKLTKSQIPKLLIYFDGGVIIKEGELAWARENLPNLKMAKVAESVHFVQEDDPHGIGQEIAAWYKEL
jgi:haloalkane dehalogenase